MHSFDNFTYFLESEMSTVIRRQTCAHFTYCLELGRTTVIRRQACAHSTISRTSWSWGGRQGSDDRHALIRQVHVPSGVGEDDRDQTTCMRSFDDLTYFLKLGRTTVIRRQACAHSTISRTLWSWGGRP